MLHCLVREWDVHGKVQTRDGKAGRTVDCVFSGNRNGGVADIRYRVI